jgi:hypothetical protein
MPSDAGEKRHQITAETFAQALRTNKNRKEFFSNIRDFCTGRRTPACTSCRYLLPMAMP